MQILDRGHAFALLGGLDAIGQANQARADLEGAKQGKTQAGPASRQDIQVKALAVEQVQEALIGLCPKVQDAHEAGDAGVIAATAQAHQHEQHPHEGAHVTTGGPQSQSCL